MLPFSLSMEMEQNLKRHHKLVCCRNAHGPTSKCIQFARVCYLGPKTNGGTFEFKGPWFTNMNFMVTSDPMNIHHMLSKNFSNYIKGQKFHENFDVLGDGIFNSESDSWRYQRKLLQSLIKHRKFELFFQQVVKGIVDKSLILVLDHVSSFGIEVDLQDIFHRFTFDSEKKFSIAWKMLDQFIYNCILSRQEELSQSRAPKAEEEKFDLLTAIGEQAEEIGGIIKSGKFLRDTAFNLLAAGRDSLSAGLTWLFWIVATHPYVEAKILGEIKEHLLDKGKLKDFSIDELSKLVYLQGICESLRPCPPVPFEHKCSVQSDILPSGHSIRPNTTMIYSLYSMEGWRAYGVKIAWTSSQRDGFQSVEE